MAMIMMKEMMFFDNNGLFECLCPSSRLAAVPAEGCLYHTTYDKQIVSTLTTTGSSCASVGAPACVLCLLMSVCCNIQYTSYVYVDNHGLFECICRSSQLPATPADVCLLYHTTYEFKLHVSGQTRALRVRPQGSQSPATPAEG